MADEATGFLGRWARRKTEVLEGKVPQEPAALPNLAKSPIQPENKPAASADAVTATAQGELLPEAPPHVSPAEVPPPSLADAQALTQNSDFKPFMAKGVGVNVRNAAMKKLFSDPHFNVMDGLDIYIDDYSKSDPIPESMLRQMTSVKFLKIFDDDEDDKKEDQLQSELLTPPRETVNTAVTPQLAQSSQGLGQPASAQPVAVVLDNSSQPAPAALPLQPGTSQQDHAHIDLRLQPDHATPAPKAGGGA